MSVRHSSEEDVDGIYVAISDVPDAPTIGTATDVGTSRSYNNGSATVTISAYPATGGTPNSYTATSTPGSFTGTAATSPITVTGLQSATSYTFAVTASNGTGSSSASSSSSAITATTVPQAPTIGTFTDNKDGSTGTLSFTAGATGGKSITGYKFSTDGSTYTSVSGTTSPLSLTGLTPGTYSFTLKATNGNGDSAASSSTSGTVAVPLQGSYDALASITVPSGGLSSITFAGIPTGYSHLQIRGIARSSYTPSNPAMRFQFNGDTGTNYVDHSLYGTGSSANAANETSINYATLGRGAYDGLSANIFNASVIDILDYANTNKYKTARSLSGYDSNSSDGQIQLYSGLWMSASAINSITIYFNVGNVNQYSTFALYGVK